MASMRRVTRKPPKMLIPHMKTDKAASMTTKPEPEPICISAPRMMIEEIALVTAIRGVCKLCATPQITWKPMNSSKENGKIKYNKINYNKSTAYGTNARLIATFNTTVSKNDTYYGMVMSVRPSVSPSVRVFHTFFLHALRYCAEILYIAL